MTLSNLSQYGIGFQIKVLSSLLTHKEFLLNIHDVMSEEYFDNQAHQWIIKEILKYYQKYHTTPSMDVLKVELKKSANARSSFRLSHIDLTSIYLRVVIHYTAERPPEST